MQTWPTLAALILLAWSVVAIVVGLLLGRVFRMSADNTPDPVCANKSLSERQPQ